MEHLKAFDLSGKTILITGASSGIGRETAIVCSQFGAKLVLTGRNAERLNETLSQLYGNDHVCISADLLQVDAIETLATSLPQLDGIFISAGVVNTFPIKFITEEKYNETIDVNFKSVVLLMARITRLKKLNQGSSVVFMSSIASFAPHKGSAMYSASKAAIEAYAKVFAMENAPMKIRANCICAAMVKTPMYDNSEKAAIPGALEEHVAHYPLGVGLPQDIAYTVVYFLSSASRWVTGSKLIMDGGYTAGF